MTIRSFTLICLATFMTASNANAECHRRRPIVISPHPHHYHRAHRIVYRPYHRTAHVITVEAPPAPADVVPGEFLHVDELAARLEVLMNEICLDLYYNYQNNPEFHETYSEAYSLYQNVRYIHAQEHNYNRAEVRQQLTGADALFHHIQEDVQGWSRVPNRQIGTLGFLAKIEMAEETLHHLMEDVGVAVTTELEEPPAPDVVCDSVPLSVPPAPSVLP